MKFEEGHWYKFREAISGHIYIGRYDGTDPENCCILCDKDSYNAHYFSVYYKQHDELVNDGPAYCKKHLPEIIEDLGESKQPIIDSDIVVIYHC